MVLVAQHKSQNQGSELQLILFIPSRVEKWCLPGNWGILWYAEYLTKDLEITVLDLFCVFWWWDFSGGVSGVVVCV